MFQLKLCVSIIASFFVLLKCGFVATNISVILSFDVSSLKSANIDYEDKFWIDKFLVLVDIQITDVSDNYSYIIYNVMLYFIIYAIYNI